MNYIVQFLFYTYIYFRAYFGTQLLRMCFWSECSSFNLVLLLRGFDFFWAVDQHVEYNCSCLRAHARTYTRIQTLRKTHTRAQSHKCIVCISKDMLLFVVPFEGQRCLLHKLLWAYIVSAERPKLYQSRRPRAQAGKPKVGAFVNSAACSTSIVSTVNCHVAFHYNDKHTAEGNQAALSNIRKHFNHAHILPL